MINVLIVSHGTLGEALIRAAEMIAGPQECLFSVSLLPEESPEGFADKLTVALRGIEGQETVVLIDLFGGTPSNVVASRLLRRPNVECVTGANLPMLLELVMSRAGGSPSGLAEAAARAGQESIRNLGAMLEKPGRA